MQSINILDMRTLLLGNIVSVFICVVVMAIWWRQSHNRFPAIKFWLRSFSMQFLALMLITLRGTIPDFLSIIISGVLVSSGIIQLYIGLGRDLGKEMSQRHNYVLQVIFLLTLAYFTYIEPSLACRNISYSAFIFLISTQCAWLVFVRVETGMRLGTNLVGAVMAAYGAINLGRVCFYLFVPPSNDLFRAGAYDAFLFLSYQVLIVALTFSLILMVNRRLHAELECEVEKLKLSEETIRTSETRLARAELAAKSGNWELHLDPQIIVASEGAATVFGLASAKLDYGIIKAIPLPEYRPLLDEAMTALVQRGAPYDVEYRIRAVDTQEIKYIHSIASFDPTTRTVFGVIQDVTDRKAVEHELERLARMDQLTNLPNRRYFLSLAEQELARTTRYGGEMSVLMVDIDNFKAINDTYGHQIGDRVLQATGQVFRSSLREVDFVGRVGGEEFAVVLPQTGIMQAFEVAERLRRAVEQAEITLDHGLPFGVTVSIGMTSRGATSANMDTLLSRADKALYEAKSQGRNQVCVFEIG
ncbi:MAG: sensor domain-containing diguanylate cyclase, partial [Betaproteobacteria bacterium]